MLSDRDTAFARHRFARRTGQTPSQWANPIDMGGEPDAGRSASAAEWAMLGLVIFATGLGLGAWIALEWVR